MAMQGVLLVVREGRTGRLGQRVVAEMDSKRQSPKKFPRRQEDDISVINSRKHRKR